MLPLAWARLWVAGAILIVAAIVIGSLLPGPVVEVFSAYDKLEHAAAYLLLTSWLTGMLERRRYPLAALGALLLGLAIELAQAGLTDTRVGDPLDLVANFAGIALGLALAYLALGGWAARLETWLGAGRR